MASPLDGLPTIQDTFLHGAVTNPALAAYADPPVSAPSQAGKGFFGAALGSGFRSLASEVASGVGAAQRATGLGDGSTVDAFAQQQKAAAAEADNTDYSNSPWYSPTGFAYRTLQGLPTMGAAALGAAGAAALAPAEAAGAALTAGGLALRGAGAAAALYPSSVGQLVQRAEEDGQPRQDGKALALGVPQAIGQGALAATGEGALTRGLGKSALVDALGKSIGETGAKVATGAAAGAVAQGAAGAAGESLMEAMGDPNRDFASRSQAILNAALMGATQGGVLGGAIHGLAKTPAPEVTNDKINTAVDAALQLTGPADQRGTVTQPQLPAPGTPGMEPRIPDTQHFPPIPEPGQPAPDVVVTPAQPGQTTPLLEPPVMEPASRPVSGEPIITPPPRPVQDTPPLEPAGPPQIEAAPGVEAARNEPVSRPASEDDPITTPPPLGDLSQASGADLLTHMESGLHHPEGTTGQQLMEEVQRRMDEAGVKPKSADDVREVLLQQDRDAATAKTRQTNADVIKGSVDAQAVRLPTFLKDPNLLGDTDRLKAAIYDRASNQKTPLLPNQQVYKAARAFGIMDADENLIDPRPKVEPEPETPDVSAIPEGDPVANEVPTRPVLSDDAPAGLKKHWGIAEKLRSNMPANLQADLGPELDRAQALMAKNERGDLGSARGIIAKVSKAVEGQKAVDAAKGVDTTTDAPVPDDNPALAKKFTKKQATLKAQMSNAKTEAAKGSPEGEAGGGAKPNPYAFMSNEDLKAAYAKVQDDPVARKPLGGEIFNRQQDGRMPKPGEDMSPKVLDPRVVEPFASRPPDDHDMAITQHIADGKSLRDILTHIVQNGSSSVRKSIAARLLQSKVDAPVRFGTQEEAQQDHPTLRNVYGDYNRATGEIRAFDQSDLEHTILEEATHAATVKGINSNPEFKGKIQSVMDAAKKLMTPDEQNHHSMSSPEEFMAATLNPDFQKTLSGMTPKGEKVSLWTKFKNVIGQFFGFPKGSETMLDHVMHLGGEAMDLTDAAHPERIGSAPDVNQTSTLYARTVNDNADRLKRVIDQPAGLKALGTGLYNRVLKWRKLDDIAVSERNSIPTFPELIGHMRDMGNANDTLNGPGLQVSAAADHLDQKTRDKYNKLMAYNVGDIDPRRTFDKHTWFANAPADVKVAKAAEVRAANNLLNDIRRNSPDKGKLFDDLVAVNRMHRHVEIVGALKNVFELPAFADHIKLAHDPMQTYQTKIDGTHSNPRAAAEYWEGQANRLVGIAQKYIGNIKNAMAKETSPEQYAEMVKAGASKDALKTAKASVERYKVMQDNHEVMSSLERDQTRKMVSLNEAPNFATRRNGSWFAAAKFKDGFTPADVKKVQAALTKGGFGDAVMQPGSDQKRIYIRTDHEQQATALHNILTNLHADKAGGVLNPKETSMGTSEQLLHAPGLTSAWASALMKDIDAKFPDVADHGPAADELRGYQAQQRAAMAQHFLDMQPESSLSKLYAKRDDVHGFDANMLDSNNQRMLNSARAMSGMFYNNKIADAQRRMREDVRTLNKAGPEVSASARSTAAAAVNEAMIRTAQRPLAQPHSVFDWAREATHIMELGLSPIYTAKLAAQIYTNAIPQLAKTHGYAAATMAVTKNMPKALAIMKATYAGLDRNHFVMSPDKLKGFPKDIAEFLLHQQNRGTFNAGARTTAMYEGVHMHSKLHRMIHDYSGATTLYSEMYPRIVTALAARDLYNSRPDTPTADYNDVHSFTQHKVNAANFDWNTMFSARATGKHGVAGAASPILSQLQGYHLRLMEMMARNISDLAGTRGKEEQKAARRFLLGHLAAVAAVGGTMGLPGANMAAGAYDRLADWATGDDTHDIKASYRQYMADTFGNGMGEALTHGVPRLAGLDLSGVGEEGVVPFTDLVASKQKWEDAFADWAKESLGPAAKIGSNQILAIRDIYNGDLLEAATKMGPEFLNRGAEAYKLGQYGYTDKSGFKFGDDPSGSEVLQKLMGFTPPAEANYDEKSRTVEGLNERETYDKGTLMSHLARAFNRHDPAEYAKWERAAVAYQRSHPGETPPMAELSTYLSEHARAAAVAGTMGVPLNLNLRDLNARGAVNYGNQNQ